MKANITVSLDMFKRIKNMYSSIDEFARSESEYFSALIEQGVNVTDLVREFSNKNQFTNEQSVNTRKRKRGRPRKYPVYPSLFESQKEHDNVQFEDNDSSEYKSITRAKRKGSGRGKTNYSRIDFPMLYKTVSDVTNSGLFKLMGNPVILKIHNPKQKNTSRYQFRYVCVESPIWEAKTRTRESYGHNHQDVVSSARFCFNNFMKVNNLTYPKLGSEISVMEIKKK